MAKRKNKRKNKSNSLLLSKSIKESFSSVSKRIETGNNIWDDSMGGGIPVGRITEIYGYNSTGKSECLQIMARSFIKEGGLALIQDVETAYDYDYVMKKGDEMSELKISHPLDLFESLEEIDAIIDERDGNETPVMIGVDSVAALGMFISMDDLKKQNYPKEAKKWAEWFRGRSIPNRLKRSNITLAFTNQAREAMDAGIFSSVDDHKTFAGEAIKYNASVRQYVEKGKALKAKINGIDRKVGFEMKITNIKSRTDGKPYLKFRIPFYYGKGWDNELTAVWFMIDNNIAIKSGKKGSSSLYILKGISDKEFTEKELHKELINDKEFYNKCRENWKEIM